MDNTLTGTYTCYLELVLESLMLSMHLKTWAHLLQIYCYCSCIVCFLPWIIQYIFFYIPISKLWIRTGSRKYIEQCCYNILIKNFLIKDGLEKVITLFKFYSPSLFTQLLIIAYSLLIAIFASCLKNVGRN